MILQALVEYYEALERKEKITSPGWCRARVAYGLDISEQGELMGIIPLKKEQQNGKKTVWVPQDLTVPQMVSRSSGVSANFLCDHSGYMLGIDNKGKPERSRECFECAKKKHKDILGNISSPAARAVCRFFDCWTPDRAAENPYLMPELEEIISGSNLVFMIDGEYVHEDPDIRQCWEEYSRQSGTGPEGVCLVTGRREEIARIHGTIKGVQGAQSSGAALFPLTRLPLNHTARNRALTRRWVHTRPMPIPRRSITSFRTGPMGQPSATRPWFTGPRKGTNGTRIYLPVCRSRPWRTRK